MKITWNNNKPVYLVIRYYTGTRNSPSHKQSPEITYVMKYRMQDTTHRIIKNWKLNQK